MLLNDFNATSVSVLYVEKDSSSKHFWRMNHDHNFCKVEQALSASLQRKCTCLLDLRERCLDRVARYVICLVPIYMISNNQVNFLV